jgi:hypothetical protein
MKRNILLAVLGLFLLSSCYDIFRRPPAPVKKVWGYKPVFSTDSALLAIRSDTARPMKQAGKIYVKDNLIFQNDIGLGVHVIDRTDPAHLVPVGFIRIRGNTEISIKDNFLYANAYQDLVVLDVSNWQQVQLVKKIPNAFNNFTLYGSGIDPNIPVPEKNVYYQCNNANNSFGIHTGWVRDSVYTYECFNR